MTGGLRHLMLFCAAMVNLTVVPAAAQRAVFPHDCKPYVTAQLRSCQVEHVARCQGAQAYLRSETYNADGLEVIEFLSMDFSPIHNVLVQAGAEIEMAEADADPISLERLLAEGKDTFDIPLSVFTSMPNLFGTSTKVPGRFRGAIALAGLETEIDGEPLMVVVTEMSMYAEGLADLRITGRYNYSARFGYIFTGTETRVSDAGVEAVDETPVKFVEPGEAGFLSTTPLFGCALNTRNVDPADPVIPATYRGSL